MDIDAFILIGGRSSRLGRDKAFAQFGGETLGERAVNTIQEGLSPRRITFVAANAAQFGIEAIRAGVPFVFDLVEGRGPLGGIHTAISYAQTDRIFILACDYPFVSRELLSLLSGIISEQFGAVIPEQPDGRLQPLCAFYRVATARPIVEEIIQRPRVPPPLHEIVRRMNPRIVEPAEYSNLPGADHFFVNVNTIEDLERAFKIERKLFGEKDI